VASAATGTVKESSACSAGAVEIYADKIPNICITNSTQTPWFLQLTDQITFSYS